MSTLIANNINNALSFQDNTGIISYRTVGFLLRGVTNTAGSPTGANRNLIWLDPGLGNAANPSYVRDWSSIGGIITAGANAAGNYLINFNLFVSPGGTSAATVFIDNVTRYALREQTGGYNNFRGSFIASISNGSQIRLSTAATIIGSQSTYSMISAFKIT